MTIDPSQLYLWRIISINNDGSIEMVSHFTSYYTVYLATTTRYYKNSVFILNAIAQAYTSPYTMSARCVGYNGQTSNIASLDSTTSYTTNLELYGEALGLGDMLYIRDLDLIADIYSGNWRSGNPGLGDYAKYWIASRYANLTGRYMRTIEENGQLGFAAGGRTILDQL